MRHGGSSWSSSRPSGDVHCHSEIVAACRQSVAVGRRLRQRPVAHVLARQEHVDLAEGRPTSVVDVAALDEQVVDLPRTDARLRQTHGGPAGRRAAAAAAAVDVDELGEQLRVSERVVRATTSET